MEKVCSFVSGYMIYWDILSLNGTKISEWEQEMPQSQITEQAKVPRGGVTEYRKQQDSKTQLKQTPPTIILNLRPMHLGRTGDIGHSLLGLI